MQIYFCRHALGFSKQPWEASDSPTREADPATCSLVGARFSSPASERLEESLLVLLLTNLLRHHPQSAIRHCTTLQIHFYGVLSVERPPIPVLAACSAADLPSEQRHRRAQPNQNSTQNLRLYLLERPSTRLCACPISSWWISSLTPPVRPQSTFSRLNRLAGFSI
jgi:hypothetical protein